MKSPGAQITDMLLEQPARKRFAVTLERKAVGPVLAGPATSETIQTIAPGATLPLRMRNLIPAGRTVGSSITYPRETAFTNTAAPIAPGGAKPLADLTYTTVNSPVVTIPAYLKTSTQILEDFAMFESWINTRLLYGLSIAEENQLLNGNGVAPNLQGLMAVAPAAPAAGTGGNALIDNVAAGIAAVYGRDFLTDGIVLNPGDWGKVIVATDPRGPSGQYFVSPVGTPPGPFLWGIPVVLTKAMAAGNYLVGQFNPNCQIFDRDDAAVEVADQNQNDFIKNLLTVRAEERLAFAIYQPNAFAKGTFTL